MESSRQGTWKKGHDEEVTLLGFAGWQLASGAFNRLHTRVWSVSSRSGPGGRCFSSVRRGRSVWSVSVQRYRNPGAGAGLREGGGGFMATSSGNGSVQFAVGNTGKGSCGC